jgi:hypothetical protein
MSHLSKLPRLACFAFLGVVCLAVAACGNPKVNKANYEKIETGMTLAQVEEILGKGKKEEGGDGSVMAAQAGVDVSGGEAPRKVGDTYLWENDTKTITVYFLHGKVTNKQSKGL